MRREKVRLLDERGLFQRFLTHREADTLTAAMAVGGQEAPFQRAKWVQPRDNSGRKKGRAYVQLVAIPAPSQSNPSPASLGLRDMEGLVGGIGGRGFQQYTASRVYEHGPVDVVDPSGARLGRIASALVDVLRFEIGLECPAVSFAP